MLYPLAPLSSSRLPCIDRTLPFWVGQPHRPLRILLRGSQVLGNSGSGSQQHDDAPHLLPPGSTGNAKCMQDVLEYSGIAILYCCAILRKRTQHRVLSLKALRRNITTGKRRQTVTAENLDQRIRIRQPSQCIANRPRICATQAVAFTTPQQLRSLSNLQWHGPVDNRDELLGVGQHSGTHVNRSTHLLAKYLIRNLEVIGNGNIDRPPRDGNGRTPCCQWLSQQGLQRIDTTTIPPIRKQRAPAPVAHNTVCKPSHSPSHNGCKSVTPDDDDDRGQPTTETRVLDAGVHDAEMRNAGTLEPALGSRHKQRTHLPTRDCIPNLEIISKANITRTYQPTTGRRRRKLCQGTLACATIQKSPFALSLRQLPPSMHSKATAHALEVHDTG
ncbi:hypothetical protein D9611_007983 [Ephemerocybe angulata]|uniref:Uncharacterized protein n=1 Tax=Ephemerocybe angulata TaxID=980116 RepID=A0A8H5FKC3_9AGAR|nr:hypothetical protein D9611_007983 [Tulosesus angulatus]